MNTVDQVKGHEKFRMADFAQWGAALAEDMGFTQEEFFRKYQESVDRKWQDTAEESTLGNKIENLVGSNGGEWKGSVSELLELIKPEIGNDKWMPRTAKALANELMRIAPVMRNVGIDIARCKHREAGKGRKMFTLRRIGAQSMGVNEGVNIRKRSEDPDIFSGPRPF